MERSILQEITDARLQAYLKKNQFADRYWPAMFPLDYRDELTWESLQGEEGANIKADVIAYDSSAPEKGRSIIGKASGKIAKTAVIRSMREEDFLMYRRLKKGATNDSEKQAILNMVFNDVDFVVNGVNATAEFLALQAASTGKVILTKDNNSGLAVEVDMGIPAANKTNVTTLFSTTATADYIAEVKKIDKAARAKGVKLLHQFMDPETFDSIVALDKVKAAYGFYVSNNNVTYNGNIAVEDLNKLLSKNRLPEIHLIDTFIQNEDAKHVRTTIQPWKEGYITFATETVLGRLQHGPIAEEDAESVKKYAVQSKKGHILVTKWSDVNPVREYTKGEGHFFPVLKNPESIFILNTKSTSTFI